MIFLVHLLAARPGVRDAGDSPVSTHTHAIVARLQRRAPTLSYVQSRHAALSLSLSLSLSLPGEVVELLALLRREALARRRHLLAVLHVELDRAPVRLDDAPEAVVPIDPRDLQHAKIAAARHRDEKLAAPVDFLCVGVDGASPQIPTARAAARLFNAQLMA